MRQRCLRKTRSSIRPAAEKGPLGIGPFRNQRWRFLLLAADTTNSHVLMSHPYPSCCFSADGEAVANSRADFKGFELNSESRAGCTFGRSSQCITAPYHVRRSVLTAPYHVSRSLCIAVFHHPPNTPPHPLPSVVPGARSCRCHFRSFHRHQQLALPHHGCRVSHVSYNEAGRTAYLSKAQDVGDHLHRRSWTVNEIDLRIHMVSQSLHLCGLLETPISQV